METEHFCITRGASYTVEEPCTDMGLGAWAEHDRKAREAREALLDLEALLDHEADMAVVLSKLEIEA